MSRYSANFTMADIFNNKDLADHLPFVNYRERKFNYGTEVSVRTQMKTVRAQIYDTAIAMGRLHYRPLQISKSEDVLTLDGGLKTSLDAVQRDIYDSLVGFRPFLMFTANNGDMIRTALKESEKNKRKYGIDGKLYLRAQSIMEIKGMSIHRLRTFMDDVMSNIMFGDDFPETQKKYKVNEFTFGKFNYQQMREAWRTKVGLE